MRQKFLAGGLLAVQLVWAQTQIDLSNQTRNVDFSAAAETRPVKTGSVLPGICQTGDLFFNTSAPAGSNLFACAGPNNWAQSTGSASFQVFANDAKVTATASLVTITAGTFRDNSVVTETGTSATILVKSGSLAAGSQVWIEFDPPSKSLFLTSNANVRQANLTLTNITAGASSASDYSSGRIPVATCTGGSVADTWATCSDARTPFSTTTLNPGPGIQIVPQSDGSLSISATAVAAPAARASNPTTYYAAGPGTASCPGAVAPIGSYQFPASANIAPGDHINVLAWFKHTGGDSTTPYINVRWAGVANSVDTPNFGNVPISANDTWAMEVDAVILSTSSLATFTRYARYGTSGLYGGGTYTPTGLTIPANLLIEFTGAGCSGGDTMQLVGARIMLSKGGSL